jgi:predicted dehydrogenase
MTNIAICGLGNIGRVHLQNLLSVRGCRVTGIFDLSKENLERVARECSVYAFQSWKALLESSFVDAVVIATPSSSHSELCCSALAAGKHVFVEKPLAGTLQDSDAIVRAEAGANKIVQVGFCERFNVAYIEAKRAVREGRLGVVRAIQSSRVAPYEMSDPGWELGVLDTATHNFDLILWLMEESPVRVLARGANVYEDDAIPHVCATTLSFEHGAAAFDTISWLREERHPLSYCAQSRMLIQGSRGSFQVDHSSRPAWIMDAQQFRSIDTVILGGPEYYGCLKLQFDQFLGAITGEVAPAVTAKESLQAERVTLAALESLRTGQEVLLETARLDSSK